MMAKSKTEVRVKKSGKRADAPAEDAAPKAARWHDRWVRRALEDPTQLLSNDLNWRMHPRYQQMAMEGVLDTLGWLDTVKVNINSGRVFDGHMRCEIAVSARELVPTDYYDLTCEEERLALATFNPIAALAVIGNAENYAKLADLAAASGASEGLKALAAHTAGRQNIQAAFATDFLSSFLSSSAVDATGGASTAGTGSVEAGAGPAHETSAGGASEAAAASPQITVVDPQNVASLEYLKVVFNFLPHQKKALFKLLNEQQVERGMQDKTHAEVLLVLLGVSLTDETA